MSPAPAEGVPARLIAGDRWQWRLDMAAAAWPAGSWDLACRLAPESGVAPITAAAVRDGTGALVSIPSAVSALAPPGRWRWVVTATDPDGERVTVAQGVTQVDPDPGAAGDTRSTARRMLDAIEARIAGRIVKDADAYQIEGRSITRTPLEVLIQHRARLRREVAAEEAIAATGRAGPVFRRVRISDGGT